MTKPTFGVALLIALSALGVAVLAPKSSPAATDPSVARLTGPEEQAKQRWRDAQAAILEKQQQGYDVSAAQALLRKAFIYPRGELMTNPFYDAWANPEIGPVLDETFAAIEAAKPRPRWQELNQASKAYTELIIEENRTRDLLSQVERAIPYSGSANADLSDRHKAAVGKYEATCGLIDRYEKAYDAAYKFDNVDGSFATMSNLAGEIRRSLAAASSVATALLEKLKLEATAKIEAPSEETISKWREDSPSRQQVLKKDQLFNTIICGSTSPRWHFDYWDAIAPLRFDFMQVDTDHSPHYEVVILGENEFDFTHVDRCVNMQTAHGYPLNVGQSWMHVPGWFKEKYGAQEVGIWRKGEPVCINIFHPAMKQVWVNRWRATARHYRDNPLMFCYEVWNEPPLMAPDDINAPVVKYIETDFRQYLKQNYASIDALNSTWGASYANWDDVHLPASLIDRVPQSTPLIAQFKKFWYRSLADFQEAIVKAIHEEDPVHPVVAQNPDHNKYELEKRGWDVYTYHTVGGGADNCPYQYGLNRYFKKPAWDDEFILYKFRGASTAAMEQTLWEEIMWGVTGFNLFELDRSWVAPFGEKGSWNNELLLHQYGYSLVQRSAGAMPVVMDRARKWAKTVAASHVITDPLTVLDSQTSFENTYPSDPRRERAGLERVLKEEEYHFVITPEQAMADGKEDLKENKVLLAMDCAYLPEEAMKKIVEWMRSGGTLVSLGPTGLYDALARKSELFKQLWDDLALEQVQEVASQEKADPERPAARRWRWKVNERTAAGITISKRNPAGDPIVLEHKVGEGKVVMLAEGLEAEWTREYLSDVLRSLLPSKLMRTNAKYLSVMREGPNNERFLWLVNLNLKEPVTQQIYLDGTYSKAADLGVADGFPVPLKGELEGTSLNVTLGPGQGTILLLEP